MHEISIIESLADEIPIHMPPDAILRRVVVDVGSLEHLDDELLQAAWAAVAAESPFSGATLAIHRVMVRIRCGRCGHEYVPDEIAYLVCPVCADARPEVLQGWGVTLRTLEVDVPEPAAISQE